MEIQLRVCSFAPWFVCLLIYVPVCPFVRVFVCLFAPLCVCVLLVPLFVPLFVVLLLCSIASGFVGLFVY